MFRYAFFDSLGRVVVTQCFQPDILLLPGSLDANVFAVLERVAFLLHATSEVIKAVGNGYEFINAVTNLLLPRSAVFQIYPFVITADDGLANIVLSVERFDTVPLANLIGQSLYLLERSLVGIKVSAFQVIDIDLDVVVNLSRVVVSCDNCLNVLTEHFTN